MFPQAICSAGKEAKKYREMNEWCKSINLYCSPPPIHVLFNGKSVQKLGEWEMNGYHYAAIRPIEHKPFEYYLVNPKYLMKKRNKRPKPRY